MYSFSKLKYSKTCINLTSFQRFLSFRKNYINHILYLAVSVRDFLDLFLSYHRNRLRLLLSSLLDKYACFLGKKYFCSEAKISRI